MTETTVITIPWDPAVSVGIGEYVAPSAPVLIIFGDPAHTIVTTAEQA